MTMGNLISHVLISSLEKNGNNNSAYLTGLLEIYDM